jgi:hypothetical protein
VEVIRQHHNGLDCEWMFCPHLSKGGAQAADVFDEETRSAIGKIDGEEEAAAGDEIASVIRHGRG